MKTSKITGQHHEPQQGNPTFTMLIGCPGSGKSTWRKSRLSAPENAAIVLSTDDYIETKAKEHKIPYNKAFSSFFDEAEQHMLSHFNYAIQNSQNILVDRTNVSKKSRRRFLSKLPKSYTKIAVVFQRDLDYLIDINNERLENGRDVPISVIEHMHIMYTTPTLDEGFDEIVFVGLEENI